MRPLRRVRFAEQSDRQVLTELYERLNSCNANPAIVDQAISQTQSCVRGGVFERVTLIAEEQKDDDGVFYPEATASFFSPDEKDEGLLYYSQERDHLELKERRHDFVEFGGLVAKPDTKGYCSFLTPSRALIVRWMKDRNLIQPDQVLIEFLPKYIASKFKDRQIYTNAFWEKLILPYLEQSGNLELLQNELKCSAVEVFTILKNLTLSERNNLIQKYFPLMIDNSLIDEEVDNVMNDIAAPAAKAILERMYNLRTIGYFPVDGGLNCIGDISTGFTGEVQVPVEIPSSVSNFNKPAIVSSTKNPTHLYLVGGIWAENTALISASNAHTIGLKDGDTITYRLLPTSR